MEGSAGRVAVVSPEESDRVAVDRVAVDRGGVDRGGAAVPLPAGYVPPYVRAVVEEAARTRLEPVTQARGVPDPAMPLLVSVVRDEVRRLPGWLAHYRGLGVTRFAIIDNGSRDGTQALLAAEPDVTLYSVHRPFPGKQGWINALIAREGYDRWYLHVDADERLVFDGARIAGASTGGAGSGRTLADLVAHAGARGMRRVRGMLVDLYPEGALVGEGAVGDGTAREGAPGPAGDLFDAEGYVERLCLERISRKGGPRRRGFGAPDPEESAPGEVVGAASPEGAFDPELTKYPLFHIRAGEVVASPHHLHPYGENYRSPCLIGLLHDKFGPGFRAHAERAAVERNYWAESLEYRRLLARLGAVPGLTLAHAGSRRYREPQDLVDAGLIEAIAWEGGTAGGLPSGGLPGGRRFWSRDFWKTRGAAVVRM